MKGIIQMELEEDQTVMDLPPGFRFHPTDEELITHYLSPKLLSPCFCSPAIGEVDFNNCEPWDLPGKAKMGEKEWYFFSVRDRKYPTGLRTNRATQGGYWKATGRDKDIFRGRCLVGMRKTLVFYKGRAPNGEKSNWVMHEYRLEGQFPASNNYHLPTNPSQKEWVICRVMKKSGGSSEVKKGNEMTPSTSVFPPSMGSNALHVTCFSDSIEDRNDVARIWSGWSGLGRFDESENSYVDGRFDCCLWDQPTPSFASFSCP